MGRKLTIKQTQAACGEAKRPQRKGAKPLKGTVSSHRWRGIY